jgi:membrane protease YdiL (CAAX protease family)
VTENQLSPLPPGQHPVLVVIFTFLTVFLGFALVGPLIGLILALPSYDGDFLKLAEDITHPVENVALKTPLYIVQGAATFFGLVIGPALLLFTLRKNVLDFFRHQSFSATSVSLTVLIVIVFMGLNSFFIEWNATVHFPDSLKHFEQWAREKENYAKEVTTFLTKFDSTGQFLLAFLVIAILPAIGEELVFRGLIQRELSKVVNIHVSIWLAAFFFSAIHMQFFGFVPRMLLGALFGYLYYWSGNLSLAMLAHFINNGVAVVGLYFYQQGTLEFDMESPEALPLPYIIASAFFTAALLYYFKKHYQERTALNR